MDYSSPLEIPRKSWSDRILAFFEVLLLSGLISAFFAALPFSIFQNEGSGLLLKNARLLSFYLLLEAAITFSILALIMKAHGENLAGLGLHWEYWKRNALLGLYLVPLFFLANIVVAQIFKHYLPKYYLEQNPLTEAIQTPGQLVLFIFSALIAGGIKEEVQRAFILNRFRDYLGGAWVGLILWSLLFGAGHYVQGVQGIVVASLYGLFFGILYLATRSLIAPIVAHGAYDTIALLAYWFLSDRPQ